MTVATGTAPPWAPGLGRWPQLWLLLVPERKSWDWTCTSYRNGGTRTPAGCPFQLTFLITNTKQVTHELSPAPTDPWPEIQQNFCWKSQVLREGQGEENKTSRGRWHGFRPQVGAGK